MVRPHLGVPWSTSFPSRTTQSRAQPSNARVSVGRAAVLMPRRFCFEERAALAGAALESWSSIQQVADGPAAAQAFDQVALESVYLGDIREMVGMQSADLARAEPGGK